MTETEIEMQNLRDDLAGLVQEVTEFIAKVRKMEPPQDPAESLYGLGYDDALADIINILPELP